MTASATDVIHAALYVLPGAALLALVIALRAAGRRAAAYAGAPRWARGYYRFSTLMLSLVGAGVLAIGVAFAAAVLRR